ncbi:flavin monoamine oxidase family protein [Microvirga terricola]|uniref:Tryptophan 2-monooxygenase n=1 Tax=Microvirga terricola TaxID=2719797 RepID=A0ABX0V9Z3_9HYPH|nr:NAD(P)/FAD-dependent oxidoreductase [Microvirga terricola]NIX76368.1 FAD-dependent oxidoreductase [Microvirga terricola]
MRITRRGLLAGTASLMIARRALASDVDVLVVGAGAAGLAAAKTLRAAGRTVTVVEARSRIGGRAHTDSSLGASFDAGAHYVHWSERNPWRKIADELGIRLNEDDDGGGLRVYRDGVVMSEAERRRRRSANGQIERLVQAAGAMDYSFADAVRGKPPEMADAAGGITLFALGEDPERVSLHDYDQLWSGDDYIPAGGYGALVARYGADVPVQLDTPVTHLYWGDGRVAADTPRGTVRAQAAIVTVPVGVLQAGGIRFTPELPAEIQEALEGLHMGALTKIALRVDRERFGKIDVTDLVDVQQGGPVTSFELWPDDEDLVLAYIGGDHARELCRAGESAATDFAVNRLASMLGARARDAVTGGRLAGWWSDPYAMGSYSIVKPGYVLAREGLRLPIGDRLWLAGEATAGGGAMTVGGATLEGERAANELMVRLGA